MYNFDQIAEGWVNVFLDKLNFLDSDIKEMGLKRIGICLLCPVRNENKCDANKTHVNKEGKQFNGCGCNIVAKTLSSKSSCPGNFW